MNAPIIIPAETLQVDTDHPAPRAPRFPVWALWVVTIALVGCHPIWVAAGMPVPAFLSPVMEILNDV